MTSVAERERVLKARLAELDVRLHGIEDALESHDTRDWDDLATEREEDEVLEGIGQSGLAEIAAIRAALDRIAEGTYGDCVKCGAPIEEARLDILPATPFCRSCAG